MNNNLIFSLEKSCEDLIKTHPGDASQLMANLISAHSAIYMRQALHYDKLDPTIASQIASIQEMCNTLVGDAMADYSAN